MTDIHISKRDVLTEDTAQDIEANNLGRKGAGCPPTPPRARAPAQKKADEPKVS